MLFSPLGSSREFKRVVEQIQGRERKAGIGGLVGSAGAYLLAGLVKRLPRTCLIVTSNEERADSLFFDLNLYLEEKKIYLFQTQEQIKVCFKLAEGEKAVIIAPLKAFLTKIISKENLLKSFLLLKRGLSYSPQEVVRACLGKGYSLVDEVERQGEISRRGGIVDFYPPIYDLPLRLEFFGNCIDSLRFFDPLSQSSCQKVERATICLAQSLGKEEAGILNYLSPRSLLVIDDEKSLSLEAEKLTLKGPSFLSLSESRKSWSGFLLLYLSPFNDGPMQESLRTFAPPSFWGKMEKMEEEIKSWREKNYNLFIISLQAERIGKLLGEKGISYIVRHNSGGLPELKSESVGVGFIRPVIKSESVGVGFIRAVKEKRLKPVVIIKGSLSQGFECKNLGLVIISDQEIFGQPLRRVRRQGFKERADSSFLELSVGDFAVHVNYGIAKYGGIKRLKVEGTESDYLFLQYAKRDKLYVPIFQANRVQKYVGPDGRPPQLNRLQGGLWEWTKRKVKQKAKSLAKELLELYASRETLAGFSFSGDTTWQKELEASFPYEETKDQERATQEVKLDMEGPKPMDRLICGDVGYGKTEVAVRAAFKAIMDGKQVALLVPTTILAQQHLRTFKERLATFPLNIEMLSRFKPPREQRKIILGLKQGVIDLVIGTHRLIQKDIEFKDLGLVIIDEEQRFGVAHKEKLKKLRKNVDVLTLTATPIPRTFYMSLLEVRDMSNIDTPPEERLSIITYLEEYSDKIVREAISRELERGGQVYFLHNRVETIENKARHLQNLIPSAKIGIVHGQLPTLLLERTMLEFMEGAYNLLVCTTIIENGLDLPNVNTIIISEAEKLGLAQAYQLRGRVGRSNRQAYAYLLYSPLRSLSLKAEERLLALREFTELGSGFRLAKRDLEIRGAGNLLGREQSGFVSQVGFELYCQLLSQAIKELKGKEERVIPEPTLELSCSAYIPQSYILDSQQKILYYKKMAGVETEDEIKELKDELEDRYGSLPEVVSNLLRIVYLKILAKRAGIKSMKSKGDKVVVKFLSDSPALTKEVGSLNSPQGLSALEEICRGSIY